MNWLNDFRANAPERAKVMLVGNKVDLIELDPSLRCADLKAIQNMVAVNKLTYVETSAAVDKNINEAFYTLLDGTNDS